MLCIRPDLKTSHRAIMLILGVYFVAVAHRMAHKFIFGKS